MLNNKKIALLLSATALFLSSCKKDIDDILKVGDATTLQLEDYGASYAAPLIYSDLSLKNLINDNDDNGIIQSYSDGLLYAVYDSVSYSLKAGDIFTIPNASQAVTITPNATQQTAFTSVAAGTAYELENNVFTSLNFNFGSVEIDQMSFQSGQLVLSFPNASDHPVSLLLEFPYLTKNGLFLSQLVSVPANTPNHSVSIDLSDYSLDMTNGVIGEFNTLLVKRRTTFTKNGASPLPASFPVNISFNSPKFNLFKGYLGQNSIPSIDGHIDIDFFTANLNGGVVTLNDPRLVLKLENQMGLPLSINSVAPFTATNINGGVTSITGFPAPYNIGSATITSPWTGKIQMDKTNSNIDQTTNSAANKVEKIDFKASLSSNPSGNVGIRNFVKATDVVTIKGYLELPMDGTANNFSFQDTFDIDLTNGVDSVDYVKDVLLRFNTTNGMPLDLGLQAVFLNANKVPVYQLFPNTSSAPIIASASVDNNGSVVSATNKITDRILTASEYKTLINSGVKYIVFKAYASTANSGATSVKIYESYKLNLRLGAKVTLENNITIDLKQ